MYKVFVVDDSIVARKMLRDLLEKNGHIVVGEAGNGQEAIDNFQSYSPDLITLDITMPIKNGVEALREIKALAPNMKIIMTSASGQKEKITECIRLGASDFVQKPYDQEHILQTIAKVMA